MPISIAVRSAPKDLGEPFGFDHRCRFLQISSDGVQSVVNRFPVASAEQNLYDAPHTPAQQQRNADVCQALLWRDDVAGEGAADSPGAD